MAVLFTQIAGATATLAWAGIEWVLHGKPTVLGAISGATAGLVAITPAACFALPGAALAIGLGASIACFYAVTFLKNRLGYNDTLDAFGVHGIGGILGTLATGVLAFGPLSANAAIGGLHQLAVQAIGVAATIGNCGIITAGLLFIVNRTIGLHVTHNEERRGLDEVPHGESIA